MIRSGINDALVILRYHAPHQDTVISFVIIDKAFYQHSSICNKP